MASSVFRLDRNSRDLLLNALAKVLPDFDMLAKQTCELDMVCKIINFSHVFVKRSECHENNSSGDPNCDRSGKNNSKSLACCNLSLKINGKGVHTATYFYRSANAGRESRSQKPGEDAPSKGELHQIYACLRHLTARIPIS